MFLALLREPIGSLDPPLPGSKASDPPFQTVLFPTGSYEVARQEQKEKRNVWLAAAAASVFLLLGFTAINHARARR